MNINLNKHLGNLIRSKRKYCGYSTQELADKIGISAGSINNIENAKTDTFNLKLLNDLSNALDIDLYLALSQNTQNKNYSFNNLNPTEDISNKHDELLYKLTSLINSNTNKINIAILLDKLINEINYFYILTKS
ncbi:helix-turn-helix domain-containing protein [uncultured Clostridium sp.]|uniref:helix-turn-helix domain-containing protein n=1 Tax=uncultured Clostridium sp. TaxID=59620 RepID=UPI0025FF2AD1|nr:helix-turn-helix transcriptional regulator [uncultured Clostridium sp.]MDU4882584.1 helix-turn-helix transcriptional regulator [Clostridium celatum]MDU7076717.1 helix-turn-helix transcriptional regulator [Clostridium celatum]